MNLQQYVDLIREINQKNDLKWDSTTATLAIYKYLKSPALGAYYKNLEMKRDYDGSPVISAVSHNGSVYATCGFLYDGKSYTINENPENIRYTLEYNGLKIASSSKFITQENKEHIKKVQSLFMNSDSFEVFTKDLTPDDFKSFLDVSNHVDFKIGKLLKLASYWHYHKDVNNDDIQMQKRILEMTLALIDDTQKSTNVQHQTMVDPIFNMITKRDISDSVKFDDLYVIGAYNDISSDHYNFDSRPKKEKIEFYHATAKMDTIKDSTVLGVVINNPDNILNKLVDTFVFDELKNLMLLQSRLALKARTLDDVMESRPIIDEIYAEAVKRSPMLETTIDERLEHTKLVDKEYDLKGEDSIEFKSIVDKIGLYSSYDSEHYLSLQTGLLSFPYDTDLIQHDKRTERFIGHDGVGPYYMIFGQEDPLTMESNSLVLSHFYISQQLENHHIEKMFINIYEDCMMRKLPLVIENSKMEGMLGEEKFKIFEKVRDKYKGIVPTIVHPTDFNKYRALLESELTYNQLIAIEPKLDELIRNNASLPVLMKSIEEYVDGNQDGVTLKNKF